jgi:hypothetical protein
VRAHGETEARANSGEAGDRAVQVKYDLKNSTGEDNIPINLRFLDRRVT